jgi:hypothetical protein
MKQKAFSPVEGLGTMVVDSALNLLLFSPSCKKLNVEKLEGLPGRDKRRTCLFGVRVDPFREGIERWGKAADSLMFARMGKPMKLYLRIAKIGSKEIPSKGMQVPVEKEIVEEMKETAEGARRREIPILVRI